MELPFGTLQQFVIDKLSHVLVSLFEPNTTTTFLSESCNKVAGWAVRSLLPIVLHWLWYLAIFFHGLLILTRHLPPFARQQSKERSS